MLRSHACSCHACSPGHACQSSASSSPWSNAPTRSFRRASNRREDTLTVYTRPVDYVTLLNFAPPREISKVSAHDIKSFTGDTIQSTLGTCRYRCKHYGHGAARGERCTCPCYRSVAVTEERLQIRVRQMLSMAI